MYNITLNHIYDVRARHREVLEGRRHHARHAGVEHRPRQRVACYNTYNVKYNIKIIYII